MPLHRKDINTETWRRVRAHVESRIAELAYQLEVADDHDTSNKLRGRIAEARNLLALETAPTDAPRPGDRIVDRPAGVPERPSRTSVSDGY